MCFSIVHTPYVVDKPTFDKVLIPEHDDPVPYDVSKIFKNRTINATMLKISNSIHTSNMNSPKYINKDKIFFS